MGAFKKELAKFQPLTGNRKWVFVPADQLNAGIGPLSREPAHRLGIVLVENTWKADRRPYHKQRLALVLINLRHFALEQAGRGVAVRHLVARGPYREALEREVSELGPLRMMEPAEREMRVDLQGLADRGLIQVIPHEGWLTTREQFREGAGAEPPWKMDRFYRRVRKESGILMEPGGPAGRRFSFDTENRLSWEGDPPAPEPPRFPVDPIKEEVAGLIERRFSHHPGRLSLDRLPGTAADASMLWDWAKQACLRNFGPYEDAMSTRSRGIFHTRISSLMNMHRLLPAKVVRDVETMDLPLSSQEGFIRQILGWREFMRHVHLSTDGFRELPTGRTPVQSQPGAGGYRRWAGRRWERGGGGGFLDGGAAPSGLSAQNSLPPAYWGVRSGLACLDQVVASVWEEGYSHHITRLMILSNFATLLDVSPRELTDWFWAAYTDAYEWVVEANVLGMGTFALGALMTTKPYVSGAAYIARMSDYCRDCRFSPKRDCPYTPLYWAFLGRHEPHLEGLPRLRMVYKMLSRRPAGRRRHDRAVFETVRDILLRGGELRPGTGPL